MHAGAVIQTGAIRPALSPSEPRSPTSAARTPSSRIILIEWPTVEQ